LEWPVFNRSVTKCRRILQNGKKTYPVYNQYITHEKGRKFAFSPLNILQYWLSWLFNSSISRLFISMQVVNCKQIASQLPSAVGAGTALANDLLRKKQAVECLLFWPSEFPEWHQQH
jgi:hypothetical protein